MCRGEINSSSSPGCCNEDAAELIVGWCEAEAELVIVLALMVVLGVVFVLLTNPVKCRDNNVTTTNSVYMYVLHEST